MIEQISQYILYTSITINVTTVCSILFQFYTNVCYACGELLNVIEISKSRLFNLTSG